MSHRLEILCGIGLVALMVYEAVMVCIVAVQP